MSWPLVLLSTFEWKDYLNRYALMPGHCCFAPWILDPGNAGADFYRSKALGDKYLTLPHTVEKPRRAPILIALPDDTLWCPDEMAWGGAQGHYGTGWTVTGDLPAITCFPSINYPGRFHSWVRNGVLEDDCEGRFFTPCGKPVAPPGARPPGSPPLGPPGSSLPLGISPPTKPLGQNPFRE